MSAAIRTHQVKTPVGNKTKRGGELEGTPKTPKPFQISPLRCASFAAEQEDLCRSQPKIKRHLQLEAFGGVMENRVDMTGAALSPICLNSIPASVDRSLGHRKLTSVKSLKEQSHYYQHQNISGNENISGIDVTMTPSNGKQPDIATENCYRDSPVLGPSGKRIFLWSNPAFNEAPPQTEVFCSGSTSSDCSSSSSGYLQDAEVRDADVAGNCDAESYTSVDYIENTFRTNNSLTKDTREEIQKDCKTVNETLSTTRLTFEKQQTMLKSPVSYRGLDGNNCMSKKALFSRSESRGNLNGTGNNTRPVNGNKELKMKEIDEEIKRLTQRLTELHVQKRKCEDELRKQDLAKAKNTVGAIDKANNISSQLAGAIRNVNLAGPVSSNTRHQGKSQSQQLSQVKSLKRGITGSVTVSKLAELRKSVSVSRRNDYTDSGDGGGSKALRRLSLSGVSSQSQNRGSISCSTTSVNRSNKQMQDTEQPNQQRATTTSRSAVTPSRLVSSRYSRAITPDAMRSSTVYKKRERTSSATSSPMPAHQRQHTSPSPSKRAATVRGGYPSRSGFITPTKDQFAWNSASDIKTSTITPTPAAGVTNGKFATMSNSSVPSTPTAGNSPNPPLVSDIASTNEIIQQIANGNIKPRLLSAAAAKSFAASSSPRVVGSPKSTAALYQCLETLVEDSKHFFNRLSPARRSVLRQSSQREIGSDKNDSCGLQSSVATPVPLPTINTSRLANLSPRDSGCVKRAGDRNPSGFFAESP